MVAASAAPLRLVESRGEAVEAGPRVLVWCDTTEAVPFETGIQRVTRRLATGLAHCGRQVVPVGWDGRARLIASGGHAAGRPGEWLLVPEIPMTAVLDGSDPVQLGRAYGLRVAAVVHDLIPLRRPGDYDSAELDRYRRYFRMFAGADLVLATTEHVAGHLRAHLASEGLRVPPISVLPLPAQFADLERVRAEPPRRGPGESLRLLTVSTWEPRKNLPVLVRAIQAVREAARAAIHLTIVGRRGAFPRYDVGLLDLVASAPDVTVLGEVSDAELAALYRQNHASAYPSVEEGFGLPVLESLWLGRPCLCHAGSAMAEVAPGGGTLLIDMADENAVVAGLARLANEPELLPLLGAELTTRPLRAWSDYAAAVAGLLG